MSDLLLEIQNSIALLIINRLKSLNALNNEALSKLDTCLSEIEKREDVRVIILADSDEKSFVAGVDISEMVNATPVEGNTMDWLARKTFGHLEEVSQVAIAAVSRYAPGGGCEIPMTCDIRVASKNTKSAQPECGPGTLPDLDDTQHLSRLVGKGRAKELIFTCDMIDTQEAYRIGLVSRVVPLAELIGYRKTTTRRIMRDALIGATLMEEAINTDSSTDLNSSLKLEANLFGLSFSTQGKKEGVTALLEEHKEKHLIDK